MTNADFVAHGVHVLVRLGTGSLFVFAALSKAAHRGSFLRSLSGLTGLRKERLLNLVGTAVLFAELTGGSMLLFNVDGVLAAELVAFLLLCFASAIAVRVYQGITRISCGCPFGGAELSWSSVCRSVGLATLILSTMSPDRISILGVSTAAAVFMVPLVLSLSPSLSLPSSSRAN